MNAIEVHGTAADGYERVRVEFAAVVAEEDGESGAQLAAFVQGQQVVDVSPGHPRTKEWAHAGVVFVYGGATLTHGRRRRPR
ncbi:hypothetical protein [Gordonia sp. NPDC058843]|uniref:hypothetical protein n=1 Tax=Gordonia sp. NPDC058843 TaxID=3346648 RepID=UPI0036A80176